MNEHFCILNGRVKFDGHCEETKPYCGAVCCKRTVVLLTPDEKDSNKYEYITPTDGCDCASCQYLRSRDAVALKRQEDGSCIYLDGANNCAIYDDRPQMCKKLDCPTIQWNLIPGK